jgi:hypothetical protein
MKGIKEAFIDAGEISQMLGIGMTKAYAIIKEYNAELEAKGYFTMRGKCPRKYFEQKIYGYEDYYNLDYEPQRKRSKVAEEMDYEAAVGDFVISEQDEKTGKWFAKFYYTNWQGIKKQKWKRGFATKKEALGFERDFLEKQSANPDMTFQNLYEIYMEDMAARLKQSTLLTKKAVLQTHILPFFGSKPINEIKASDVRRCFKTDC